MKLHLPDAAATSALAARLRAVLPADVSGWTLLLEGELGAGKSTFARALIHAMGSAPRTMSAFGGKADIENEPSNVRL